MMQAAILDIHYVPLHLIQIIFVLQVIKTGIPLKKGFKRQAVARIPSGYGAFDLYAYAHSSTEPMPHLAIVAPHFNPDKPVPVRIHSECMTGDLFGSLRCDCGEQLDAALHYMAENGGVVLYLRQEGRGIGLINKLKAYNLQDQGLNTIDANIHLGFEADERQYEMAILMLQDLGITSIQLITNNPDKFEALQQSSIQVVGRIPLIIPPHRENKDYLLTKQQLMGHLLGM